MGSHLLTSKGWSIFGVQKKHIKCIQDPPDVALYTETGGITKGGVLLKTYRCARGSTSLESFHLHLNRFIPGSSANSLNFQIYLLEGLHRWNQDRATAFLSSGPSDLRSYTGDLVHFVNRNYERLFGRKVVPSFSPPACYTGELIGVQYLFRQTGQALQDMNPDSEETAQLIEEHDVVDEREGDEGFCDVMEDPTVPDLEVTLPPAPTLSSKEHCPITTASSPSTVPPSTFTMAPCTSTLGSSTSTPGLSTSALASSTSTMAPSTTALDPGTFTPAPSSSTPSSGTSLLVSSSMAVAASQSEAEEMAVDDQNMPGFQHVDRLAEYLVDLREQTSLFLTNQQVSTIIELWGNLPDGDKKRVLYAARHQQRLLSGRFRTPKKPSQTPGVESTTRCVLGASSAPAQWPDCCRLVETIFIRLCTIYPSPKRKGKGALSRWSLILKDYHKIRQLVLGNSMVMQGTSLQLVEVNQNTLIQWHNSRVKRQELAVLLQGTNLPPRLPEATEPLLEPKTFPAEPVQANQEHQYKLPESTAGQAKQRLQTIRPKAPVSKQLFASPPVPFQIFPTGTAFQPLPVVQTVPMVQAVPLLQTVPMVQAVSVLQPGAFVQAPIQQPATPIATSGATPKRPYRRTVQANTCKKCGQFRTNETGHSQYRGRVFCPQTETVSREEWLVEMRKMFPK
ncbi:uncharacterized protein LOC125805116 isoform X2 [Astyanax mexicanus]|uniref:uncharacterized protein LOC125805116 isoform X2 n=1 Tax=Astyanax mexicanus TaxID=7994 RepID=UPI0020CB2858|nr:uncharacterized protein LOC125805116 isoform X2 [Astyanax mexicanus]